MSEWEIDGHEVNSNSLWRVIEDFENDALSPVGREELLQVLADSHRARAIYLAHFELSALLQVQAETKQEEGTIPVLARTGGQRRALAYSVLAAALVLMLTALGAALVKLRQPELPTVALEATVGTAWVTSGGPDQDEAPGTTVVEGSTVRVSSGTVRLTCDSGARFIIQGPASVRFPSFETPVVEKGWLWMDSGGGNELRIKTPEGTLRNIGTRFGIRVRPGQPSELHLIEGRVELSRTSGEAPETFDASDEARLLSPQVDRATTPLAPDPFAVIERVLQSPGSYATTILGQTPVGHWRLEGGNLRDAANEIPGGSAGLYSSGVRPGAAGVRPADGLHGFEADNRGVFMSGGVYDSLVYNLDAPGGVSPKEGAVAFWFRRDAVLSQAEVLWFAGLPSGGGLGPNDEMQVFLSKEGRLQFFMEEGRYDVLLSSPRRTDNGEWHHAVATWDLDKVELYLDGQLVARDDEYRQATGPNFSGIDVRLGKTGSGTGPGDGRDLMPFNGWLDELSLWGRMLTPAEIALQYRAAKGSPPPAALDPDSE